MPADVTIVVVAYNSSRLITDLLDSIPAAVAHLQAEVIVVDNGSTDATASIVEARPDCQLVRSSNVGYAAGLNLGVLNAHGDGPIMVLNPDLRLHPASVALLAQSLVRHDVAIVAPRVLDANGTLSHSLRRDPSLLRTLGLNFTGSPMFAEYVTDEQDYQVAHLVDWALGAALLMSRECFIGLGGWDESFFLYSEETDFCLRARDRGWLTRYEPSAVVTHIGGGSGQSGLTHSMQLVNRVRLYTRRHGRPRSWVFFALTALREARWLTRRPELARAALRALLRPSARPPQLHCSDRLLPR